MRFLLLLLLACIFQPVFAQTPVIKKTYWKNGAIKCEQSFVNDTAEGLRKDYNEDGVLIYQANYQHGKLNGEERSYNVQGTLIEVGFYTDNIIDSVRLTWYDDGRMKSQETFSLGMRNGVSRSFFHDGHEQHYANYRNGVLEGRYIDVNDQRLTVLEGYYWHGQWVWMRKFCDNKFCEMGGMDTLTGKDSIMYYDEHANLVKKAIRYVRDSVVYCDTLKWTDTGLLTEKSENGPYGFWDTLYYQDGKVKQVTFIPPFAKNMRLVYEFYPSGYMKRVCQRMEYHDDYRETTYYENYKRVESQSFRKSGKRRSTEEHAFYDPDGTLRRKEVLKKGILFHHHSIKVYPAGKQKE